MPQAAFWTTLLLLLSLGAAALGVPAAAAVQQAPGAEARPASAAVQAAWPGAGDKCTAPCGWIAPFIDLDIPDKLPCGSGTGLVLGVEAGPEDCLAPPRPGVPLVLHGTLRWYWDVSYEGTYPNDPLNDIEISFSSSPGNPAWLRFHVEPASFVVTTVDLFDPAHFRMVGEGLDAALWYWYERPITITFERVAEPTPAELERMESRDGVQPVYVRAQSTASGDRIREGFGLEEFKFHGANDPDIAPLLEKTTPSPGVAAILAVLAAVAVTARRRR